MLREKPGITKARSRVDISSYIKFYIFFKKMGLKDSSNEGQEEGEGKQLEGLLRRQMSCLKALSQAEEPAACSRFLARAAPIKRRRL